MRGNFHAKCPFNNESKTILLQLRIKFFAASLKENFIYLDLQRLWLSSPEMGTDLTTQILVQRDRKQNTVKICCLAFIPANWPSEIGKGHREDSVCYDQPSYLRCWKQITGKREISIPGKTSAIHQSQPTDATVAALSHQRWQGINSAGYIKTAHISENKALILPLNTQNNLNERSNGFLKWSPSRTEKNNGKAAEVPPNLISH